MSETRPFDGPNWRDNPDEAKPPVRRGERFLTSRGYENPEIATVKFGLAEDIRRAIVRMGTPTQAEVAARARMAGVPLAQPDVSAILNGNVKAFALERLMQVAAALGTTVSVSSTPSRDGVGHVQLRSPRSTKLTRRPNIERGGVGHVRLRRTRHGSAYNPERHDNQIVALATMPATAMPVATPAVATAPNDAMIEVIDEQLRVGKREVAAGAVRVRSYIVERPVEEQVRLREEHISVDRRPMDRPADGAAFQDRTIEEAVISKDVRVVEEIGLRKEASERVETVRDTVRQTEVEIEHGTALAPKVTRRPV